MLKTSLYIHWPFCESKCPYCDFNSHVRESIEHDKWLGAYLKEIEFYKNKLGDLKIDTIFFGGGTPSLMQPETVGRIIEKIKNEFDVKTDAEITLEANPASSEVEKFRAFKDAGINRVSIGVQSFDENILKFLGRRHGKNQAINAIESAAKILGNFSFDLIYATPGQTMEQWENTLNFALKFNSPHISLYQLTIEKGTPFYSDFHKNKFQMPEEELAADLYDLTVEKCKNKGLLRYEVSNFAKPGFESRHNLNYWYYNDYIGIGPGAHGRIHEGKDKIATMDIHSPENWLKAVVEKGKGLQSREKMSATQVIEEMIFMGLRIREGIDKKDFAEKTGKDFEEILDKKFLQKLCDEGLMIINENSVKLTNEGLLLHTNIVKKLSESI